MCEYQWKPGKIGQTLISAYQQVENKFVDRFLEEDGSMKTGGMARKVTSAYHHVEDAVVGSYRKVEHAFVNAFLERVDTKHQAQTPSASKHTDL